MTAKTEKVLILGAGIAGLAAALALTRRGFAVTLLDRDPPPPDASPDAAFDLWQRKGVSQLRHSHAFLARLSNLLRDHYPALHQELLAAGAREMTFADGLPATLRPRYRPRPEDDDLTILTCRRPTLEYVIRRYVARLDGVTFLTGTRVTGLCLEEAPRRLTGLTAEGPGGETHAITADLVIDAGGRNSPVTDWLRAAGAEIPEEEAPAGIVYFTRHYRLKPGVEEPKRGQAPGAGDLGYIKFGIFPGDNGCFSITLAVPEIETGLRRVLVHGEKFDQTAALFPGLQVWTDPARAEPVSKVFGMGNLKSQWRRFTGPGGPAALGHFAIGDALARTNPLYGRGCSMAFIEAECLGTCLVLTQDPARRAALYAERVTAEIRPFYDAMAKQDAQAIRRAVQEQNPNYRPRLKARLMKSFTDQAITPALRRDPDIFRAFMKGFNMLTAPEAFIKDPRILAKLALTWMRGPKANQAFAQPYMGPERRVLLSELGAPDTSAA